MVAKPLTLSAQMAKDGIDEELMRYVRFVLAAEEREANEDETLESEIDSLYEHLDNALEDWFAWQKQMKAARRAFDCWQIELIGKV